SAGSGERGGSTRHFGDTHGRLARQYALRWPALQTPPYLTPAGMTDSSGFATIFLPMKSTARIKSIGENVVRIEAEALLALAERLAGPMDQAFHHAVDLLYSCAGRVVVTGLGKSGLVARKVAATLNSTGTPALFLHPAEALHGDLGMLVRGDAVIALSASGETEEILQLLATMKRLQIPLVSVTCDRMYGNPRAGAPAPQGKISTLASAADVALDCSVDKEACSLGLAPTASTTTMLALGDALAMALAERRGFKEEDFA